MQSSKNRIFELPEDKEQLEQNTYTNYRKSWRTHKISGSKKDNNGSIIRTKVYEKSKKSFLKESDIGN